MALDCICIPVNDMVFRIPLPNRPELREKGSLSSAHRNNQDIDLCKILERSQDGQHKHDDYGCHDQGERRQNLINKLKMYLDDYDDRPVMKRKAGANQGDGKGLGQTGFGPLIRYPGYVDYNHPYFSSPYNRMPTLATTVNQRPGGNPCSPFPVRADDTEGHLAAQQSMGGGRHQGGREGREESHLCQCARRRGQEPQCPAATPPAQGRNKNNVNNKLARAYSPPSPHSGTSPRYCCIPLPD